MTRSTRFKTAATSLVFLLSLLVFTGQRADAQVTKPFKIKGAGMAPYGLPLPGQDPRPHWIVGVATQLGFHTGLGYVQTDTANPQPDGTITGEFGSGSPYVFCGAGGDKLVTWYGRVDHGAAKPGTFTLTVLCVQEDGSLVVEAAWIAEFVAVPAASTGKFAGVTGSWIMYAYSAPFVLGTSDPAAYWWEGEGQLTFKKGK